MQYRAEDFLKALPHSKLAAVYLIVGDEPLQVRECEDALRMQCRTQGYEERCVFDGDTNLNWHDVQTELDSPSLFSSQRIVEIRLHKRSPGADGGKVITKYCEQPSPLDVLVVTLSKADKKTQQSSWYKAIDKHGAVVQVWPPLANALPQWMISRAQRKGLVLKKDAALMLADLTEGNLLAADQELERLALTCKRAEIDIEQVIEGSTDNARYDVFNLLDSALAGELVRALRILRGLQAEGTEAVLVNWALTRELRGLYFNASDLSTGAMTRTTASYSTTIRRKLLAASLGRHNRSSFAAMLVAAGKIDQTIKGARSGDPWNELAGVITRLAGSARPDKGAGTTN